MTSDSFLLSLLTFNLFLALVGTIVEEPFFYAFPAFHDAAGSPFSSFLYAPLLCAAVAMDSP